MKTIDKLHCLLVLIILSWGKTVFSQNTILDKEKLIDKIIENLSDNSELECDYSGIEEDLNYFWENHINLNSCSTEELKKLRFLSDFQILNLQNYIKENGEMVSIYELQLINGFSTEIIEDLLPFVTILSDENEMTYTPENAIKYGKHEYLISGQQTLEKQQGYTYISDSALSRSPNSRYLGSSQKIYLKYRFNYKNTVNWGFTAEKDAGEEFFSGNNKSGFDYYSAHLFVQNMRLVKKIAVGDYHVSLGQGLIMCSDWSSGKSSYIIDLGKTGQGLTKYSSTDENKFFRGVGTTISIGNFELTGFFSKKRIDGNLKKVYNSFTDKDDYEVTAFQITGQHSVPSEVEGKHSVTENVAGGDITFNQDFYKLGISLVHYDFDKFINPSSTIYNKYEFRGKRNSDFSFNYFAIYRNIRVFGEESMSVNGGKAFLNGFVISPVSAISFSLLHRLYGADYQANYGKSFSVSGNTNEKGIFAAAQIIPYKRWNISAYYDIYSFPWLKYSVSSPSEGSDYLIQTTYSPANKVQMYIRIRHQIKETDNNTVSNPLPLLGNIETTRLRYNISSVIYDVLLLNNRIEYLIYKNCGNNPEKGFLMYQDIKYAPVKMPFSFSVRYGIFDTDSYYSSVYAYESDILFSSTPGFYSKGTRFYVLFQYKIKKWANIWFRYSQTYYSNRQIISSDLSQINGNTKSDIKVLLKIQF